MGRRRLYDTDGLWFHPQPPVQWLAPRELVDAGFRVALSSAFGEYADKRELMQLFTGCTFTADEPPVETWIDYVADLGDGFDATFSIAGLLAADELTIAGDDGEVTLPRASTVVLGGDQVYPTANIDTYTNRLNGPFQAALDHTDAPHPRLFALPGNHDWYDGLTAFVRVFCSGGWLGGWQLPQHRSYFAIQLTPGWWLWGIDIQFDGYIDQYQIEYFRAAADELGDASLVLCAAKPAWVQDSHVEDRPTPSMRNLDYFVDHCVPAGTPVRLHLAGDWHHHSRYSDRATGDQYVTSGGGGAYTSATHHLPEEVTIRRADAKDDITLDRTGETYPDVEWSKGRRWYGPLVGWWNPTFSVFVGAVYLLLGLAALSAGPRFADRIEALDPGDAFSTFWSGLVSSPIGWILIALCGGGLIGLTKPGTLPHRWRGTLTGVVHATAHLVVVSVCTWLGVLAVSTIDISADAVTWFVWSAVVFAGGSLLGSMLFGFFLVVADIWAEANANELFAAQRHEGHKSFLRMRVTDDEIEVYLVGFDECPRWEPEPNHDRRADGEDETSRSDRFRWTDRNGGGTAPRLIDRFTIARSR